MQPVPLVVPNSFQPLIGYGEHLGLRLRFPLEAEAANPPVPLAYVGRFVEEMALDADMDAFGLHAAAASSFETTPLGALVRDSTTLGRALAKAAVASSRYCAGQRLCITQHGENATLQRHFPEALRRGRRVANDFALQMLIDIVRCAAGPLWRPTELRLEGPAPDHAEELAALAERSMRFEAAADCLVFPRSLLALPLPPASTPLHPPSPPLPEMEFADSIRQTIRCLLELGELNLRNVAESAGTTARSLQRVLVTSGLSYRRLVDETRFQAACRLLNDPGVRIIDVAVELGYTDAANFTRAFRRWAGVSPQAFRRAVRIHGSRPPMNAIAYPAPSRDSPAAPPVRPGTSAHPPPGR